MKLPLNLLPFIVLSILAHAEGPKEIPQRIIPLLPSLAETAVEILGGDSRIVGVSEYSDFPASLSKKPSIGPYSKPNIETIVSLKPDLVLASSDGSPQEAVARLKKIGIPVLSVGTESIEDVRNSYRTLGKALGREKAAAASLEHFDRELAEVENQSKERLESKKSRLRVLLQVGDDPLIVAGGKSFLSNALERVGAENIYRKSKQAYPRASFEDVLKRNPDAIVLVSLGNDLKPFERAKKKWEAYPALKAVRTNQVIILRSDALVRPGPRFPSGLRELEKALFK